MQKRKNNSAQTIGGGGETSTRKENVNCNMILLGKIFVRKGKFDFEIRLGSYHFLIFCPWKKLI